MVRRGRPGLTIQEVKDRIEKYGYFLQQTHYTNQDYPMKVYDAQLGKNVKLSLKQINYQIKTGKRSEYDIYNILNSPESQAQQQQPRQYTEKRYNDFVRNIPNVRNVPRNYKHIAHALYRALCQKLSRKQPFTFDFVNNTLNNSKVLLYVIVQAFNTVKPIMNKIIRIKITDTDGNTHWESLSYDTINYFEDLLKDKTPQEISTSLTDLFDSSDNWARFEFKFEDMKTTGGFFPFINKLKSLDLSQFDIFNEIKLENYKNNCFIDALTNSNKFNSETINLLKSSIFTRLISLEYIQKVSDLLNTNITIRIPNEFDNKTSAKIFKPKDNKSNKDIVIFLYMNHFMINNELFIQEYYIKNHEELDKKYPDDNTRFEIVDDEGNKKHQKITIIRLIKLLRKYNLLEPIPENEQFKIASQYEHFQYKPKECIDEYFKPIIIKDKSDKQQDLLNELIKNDGYWLFGEHITDKNKLSSLYDDLQEIINKLGVNVRARNYKRFPELMNKLMYEYGCFDNVYSIAQPLAEKIREELTFPKPHTTDGEKFYSNKKLYYVDLNSAYLSVIEGIPEGKCNENGEFEGVLNTKIKELIHKLYAIRQEIKNTNPTLATCLKLLLTSSWGSSIKRNRLFKKQKPKDINSFISSHFDFIVEYDNEIVKMIKSVSFQYSYPQFAREVLNNYHKRINEIRQLVKVYYENIDAFLIDEDDYNKLLKLGLVGNELGKFKIEHVFKEIAIMSSRKYVATLENGEHFIHCINKDIDYNKFVECVKNNKYATKLTKAMPCR